MAEGSVSAMEVAKKEIRSLLSSRSGNCLTMRQLSNDYKEFVGGEIPFAKLGYSTLTSFLDDMKDTVFLERASFPRGAKVHLVPSDNSAHILDLVNNQNQNQNRNNRGRTSQHPNGSRQFQFQR